MRSLRLKLVVSALLFFFFNCSAIEPSLTLFIPMRDGTQLPTDIYLPPDKKENLPCILIRNPSGRKTEPWLQYHQLTHFGYAVAFQDTRSALDATGKTFPFLHDGWGSEQDGYDTVEWLAKHPITNGKIGTIGFSAAGITQLLMAPSAPPSLQCQYIGIAAASLYHHAIFSQGTLLKNQVEGWLNLYAKDKSVIDFVQSQPLYNEFWEKFNSLPVSHQVQVPGFIYGGWYDTFLKGTIDSFVARQKNGGSGALGKQKLLIGPWTHHWPRKTELGDFKVPNNGAMSAYDITPQRWFDYYLKGIDNGIEDLPNIVYYVMGPFDGSKSSGNVWRTAENWPIPAKKVPFYLNQLQEISDKQALKEKTYNYIHNPANPIPTLGGKNLFLESGPKDQLSIESRSDIVVFTSPPLKQDIEVTGDLSATIYFSSNLEQTDVIVRLTDVYPDGRSILIADGIHHFVKKNNTPQKCVIDLWPTSIVFAKGHKLRVSISSSSYPKYDNNQTNLPNDVAENKIFVGKKYPSSITLPVVRQGNEWLVTPQDDITDLN
ncbi:MAG: acylase [Chlamydia sp. 32-24]|nr:MAG: acylase [Chlamydia sp. 32-24]